MSQWWLYILTGHNMMHVIVCLMVTLSHRPALRQYLLHEDLRVLLPRMHVQPVQESTTLNVDCL